jgi:hypothetical protein
MRFEVCLQAEGGHFQHLLYKFTSRAIKLAVEMIEPYQLCTSYKTVRFSQ